MKIYELLSNYDSNAVYFVIEKLIEKGIVAKRNGDPTSIKLTNEKLIPTKNQKTLEEFSFS